MILLPTIVSFDFSLLISFLFFPSSFHHFFHLSFLDLCQEINPFS